MTLFPLFPSIVTFLQSKLKVFNVVPPLPTHDRK